MCGSCAHAGQVVPAASHACTFPLRHRITLHHHIRCRSAGGRAAGYGGVDAPPEDEDDSSASPALSLLAHALADLSRLLGARLEPYALGPVSAALARQIAELPQSVAAGGSTHHPAGAASSAADALRQGAAHLPGGAGFSSSSGPTAVGPGGSIGLVLLDRSLDLVTPCSHAEHCLDALLAATPRAEPAPPPPCQRGANIGGAPAHISLRCV